MTVTYSVTAAVPAPLVGAWVAWMKAEHIPAVLATGCFTGHALQQVIDPLPDDGTVLINCSYHCNDAATLQHYRTTLSPALQQDAKQWLEAKGALQDVHFFRSVLQSI